MLFYRRDAECAEFRREKQGGSASKSESVRGVFYPHGLFPSANLCALCVSAVKKGAP